MINVVKYNPEWLRQFRELKEVYLKHLRNHVLHIEHVGSTSVPGLRAKPILDIDIIVKDDLSIVVTVISILEKIGYEHVGDLGIPGREAFKNSSSKVPNDGSGRVWPKHHLYLCREGTVALNNHLRLRDFLRNNPKSVEAYGRLKTNLAHEFPDDIDAYIKGKTKFITDILLEQGMHPEHIEEIKKQNDC